MVEPLSLGEQRKRTRFLADHYLAFFVSVSSYNAAFRQLKDGTVTQSMHDLHATNTDIIKFKKPMREYGVTDWGPNNMYDLKDPSGK